MRFKVSQQKLAELERLARQYVAEAERTEDALRSRMWDLTFQRLTQAERAHVWSFCRKNDARDDPIWLGQLHRTAPPDWATPEEIAAALHFERVYFQLYRQYGGQYTPPEAPCGKGDDEALP